MNDRNDTVLSIVIDGREYRLDNVEVAQISDDGDGNEVFDSFPFEDELNGFVRLRPMTSYEKYMVFAKYGKKRRRKKKHAGR